MTSLNDVQEDEVGFAREDVLFASGDGRCAAWLYRPRGSGPPPVIVMAHGFAATRDLRLGAYAERFAAAGYAVLVFDYRHFGASPGEPRQLLSIGRQHEDWRCALAYARRLDGVDGGRVIAWGSSLAGGHVLHTAAADHDLAAVVVQVPHVSGPASAWSMGARHLLRLTAVAIDDVSRMLTRRTPRYIPAAGDLGTLAVMVAANGMEMLYRLAEEDPGAVGDERERIERENRVAARVLVRMPLYSPGRDARGITAPTLVQIASQDALTPPAVARRAAAGIPDVEIKTYDCGHFDPYLEPHFNDIVTAQLAFLARTVPVAGSRRA